MTMSYKKSNNAGGLYGHYNTEEYRGSGFLKTIFIVGVLVAAVAAGIAYL